VGEPATPSSDRRGLGSINPSIRRRVTAQISLITVPALLPESFFYPIVVLLHRLEGGHSMALTSPFDIVRVK
jgi:hypothetical protein